MAKTLFALKKEGSSTNAFEILDTAGVVSFKIDGTSVLGEQAAAVAAVAGAVPAGGAGAAAGGWDTAANRDIAIATIAEIKAQLNDLLVKLRAHGIIAT